MITRDTILDYLDDIRANPENYVTFGEIVQSVVHLHRIRKAPTLKALNEAFQAPAKAAKAAGDKEQLAKLIEVKDARKKELEAV